MCVKKILKCAWRHLCTAPKERSMATLTNFCKEFLVKRNLFESPNVFNVFNLFLNCCVATVPWNWFYPLPFPSNYISTYFYNRFWHLIDFCTLILDIFFQFGYLTYFFIFWLILPTLNRPTSIFLPKIYNPKL